MSRPLRLLGVAACAAIALAGCSHHPKAVVAPVVSADTLRPDSVVLGPTAAESTGTDTANAPARAPRKPVAAKPAAPDSLGVVAGSSTSAPSAQPPDTTLSNTQIAPLLTVEQQRELEKSIRESIEAATTNLKTVDEAKLDADQQQKYRIAQGFLNDAVTARNVKDWVKASQLATKARVLAEELVAH